VQDRWLQAVADELRDTLDVTRVAIRAVEQDGSSELIAEALAAGQPSVSTVTAVQTDPNSTYQWLLRERTLLVQDRVIGAVPTPPEVLHTVLGIRSQMLGPVVVDDHVAAVISVHHAQERDWTTTDSWHLGIAVEAVRGLLTR